MYYKWYCESHTFKLFLLFWEHNKSVIFKKLNLWVVYWNLTNVHNYEGNIKGNGQQVEELGFTSTCCIHTCIVIMFSLKKNQSVWLNICKRKFQHSSIWLENNLFLAYLSWLDFTNVLFWTWKYHYQ